MPTPGKQIMNKAKIRSLSYIAGIIDGEGSINILRQRNKKDVGKDWYYLLRICVKMTDGKVIDYINGHYNGCVCFRPGSENHTRQFDWHISGVRAMKFLKDILPFLVGKKKQAELGIRFQIHRKQGRKVNHEFDIWCQQEMKRLHHTFHNCAAVETKHSGVGNDQAIVHAQKKNNFGVISEGDTNLQHVAKDKSNRYDSLLLDRHPANRGYIGS